MFWQKSAFLVLFILTLSTISFAVAPTMQVSRTEPTGNITPGDVSIIKGYCNASDSDSPEVLYWYTWYQNSAPFSSGQFGKLSTTQQNATPDSFGYDASIVNPTNAEDNDYGTYAHAPRANGVNYYIYYNYSASIPADGIADAQWQVKHGNLATYNITLTSSCFSQNPIQLRFEVHIDGNNRAGTSQPQCYYSSAWNNIGTLSSTSRGDNSGGYAYDQDIFFTTPQIMYPQNFEQNVANITSNFEGEWYLRCQAQDLTQNSTTLDSGKLNVTTILPLGSCQNLDVKNMEYSLDTDITSISSNVCFNVTADNITLECNNNNITGQTVPIPGSYGIYSNSTNTTIHRCTVHSFETGLGFSSTSSICNSTENNLSAVLWINNQGTNNVFNTSTKGNIYYFSDERSSWSVYDITTTSAPDWADGGSDRPFDSSLGEWTGNGEDYHPWTENESAGAIVDTSINCSSFSFGSLDPGTSDNAAAGNPPCRLENTANSNVAVDIYLNASNMTSGGNWISFRNLSVWTANSAASSIPLNATNMQDGNSYLNGTTADTGFIEDLAVSSTVDFYFWQDVPAGQAIGTYNADITFHSVATGLAP